MSKEIMNYANEVAKALKDRLADCEITVSEYLKNNDTKFIGISVSKTQVSPVFYIDDYFKKQCDVNDVADNIVDSYKKNSVLPFNFVSEDLTDWDKVKDRVIFTLANKEKNAELLAGIPHTPVLDLVKVYKILFDKDNGTLASAKITNGIIEKWGIALSELDKVATKNTPKLLPEEVLEIGSLLGMPELDDTEMLVITNKEKINGASAALYPNTLNKINDTFGGNGLYIIPSSIHEVLAIPKTDSMSINEIVSVIMSINGDPGMLADNEVLSNNLYEFNNGNLFVAKGE